MLLQVDCLFPITFVGVIEVWRLCTIMPLPSFHVILQFVEVVMPFTPLLRYLVFPEDISEYLATSFAKEEKLCSVTPV